MNEYIKTMNSVTSMRDIKRYLEIGVRNGGTFLNVDFPDKTGVDPEFRFNITPYENSTDVHLFPITSDKFFGKLPGIQEQVYSGKPEFDLIFIDGMHTYKQSMKDFTNSLEYSHPNTIWIFDDVIPSDPYSALPDPQKSAKMRSYVNLSGTPWHGDVYKTLYAIHDFYPQFSYATIIDNGNPHTLLWKTETPVRRKPLFANKDDINKMNYFDMCETCAILNPVSLNDAISLIGNPVDVPVQLSTAILPSIIKPLKTR